MFIWTKSKTNNKQENNGSKNYYIFVPKLGKNAVFMVDILLMQYMCIRQCRFHTLFFL